MIVRFWTPGEPTPFVAVSVICIVPLAPVAVPVIVAFPAVVVLNVRPRGNVPTSETVGVGVPAVVIAIFVVAPMTTVAVDGLVMVAGTPEKYDSALAIAVPVVCPPTASKVPPGSKASAAFSRGVASEAVAAQVPVDGLKSSAETTSFPEALTPPAAMTCPVGSAATIAFARGELIDPVDDHEFVVGL